MWHFLPKDNFWILQIFSEMTQFEGVVMFYPCLLCPSDNVWPSWRADAPRCAHLYCYHTFLDHTRNVSRKVRAPRLVIASGASNNVQNCHLDKTNMDKHHNTQFEINSPRKSSLQLKSTGESVLGFLWRSPIFKLFSGNFPEAYLHVWRCSSSIEDGHLLLFYWRWASSIEDGDLNTEKHAVLH